MNDPLPTKLDAVCRIVTEWREKADFADRIADPIDEDARELLEELEEALK